MANSTLFKTGLNRTPVPPPDAVNSAGAPAYAFSAKHALAQYAATGCLNDTFYASAEMQLDVILRLCERVPTDFIAQTALYARERGQMKDLPALLCAVLSVLDPVACERIFDRVIDDGKMLRNFVQILRSGVVGRKSLASFPKRLVRRWFAQRDELAIFRASVGQNPSLSDVIMLAHPKPASPARSALYGYLHGRTDRINQLPQVIQQFEAYKVNQTPEVPNVPFQMLTALPLDRAAWAAIARNATWQQTRLNLNTFARHGVFETRRMTTRIAERLRDRTAIRESGVLPYQLMVAHASASREVPAAVLDALQAALEESLRNVPAIKGKVYVCTDVSGSMGSPITGHRPGATSVVRCIDVAALISAALLRNNDAEVLPFESHVVTSLRLNARDSVLTNAAKLAAIGGGGTNCSAPLAELNRQKARGELVVLVSDNESWVDSGRDGTQLMKQWAAFKTRNPRAKLVCIDLQPNRTTQAQERGDILNIGGFSDAVFDLLSAFCAHGHDSNHWVATIEGFTASA